MSEAFICDGCRTPIGRLKGALSTVRTDDLAAIPIQALIARNGALDPASIDDVMLGCANQAGEDNRNVARMAGLLAGLPEAVSATTLNRLCGSGLDAVGAAARAIRAGDGSLMIAGGVESMTRAPYVLGKAATGFDRAQQLEDTTLGWRFVNPVMQRRYGVDSMPQTAENVAREWGIGRDAQDRFALESQSRAAHAQRDGRFDAEIVPVHIRSAEGEILFARDEHLRATSAEGLAKLRPLFEGGSVTAGNASGLNDGAAAMFVANEQAASAHGLTPRARVLAMATAGVAPRIMGMGPVAAVTRLLDRTGIRLDQIDLIELNEAFAAQALAVLGELGISAEDPRVNPNGGAIALGHPLGMSGARLAITAVEQLHRTSGRLALITMCIGVGQGIALLLERV